MKEKIRAFIEDQFLYGERSVKDDENLFESGIIDSMGLLRLLAFLESEFGVSIEMKDIAIENFDTIDKIMDIVLSKTKNHNEEG